MANIPEPIKKILKIWKICLRTYYIAGHIKPRGPRSLGLWHANPFLQKTFNLRWIILQRILLCNWQLRL